MTYLKKIFYFLFTAQLIFVSFNAEARIKIINKSNLDIITLRCTGTFPPVSITKKHPPNLAWSIVKLIIGASQGSCVFYNGQIIIAAASVSIASDLTTATITEFDLYDQDIRVDFSPTVGTNAQDINVVIIPNTSEF